MDKRLWSNKEFNEIKERINKEILRRGSFRWNDPLTYPSVGQDKSPAIEIPRDGNNKLITDKSYTINNPSSGAIIETRNRYTDEGSSLANEEHKDGGSGPDTSAAIVNVDEMRNYLIGLAKIQDIKLFYGRDEEHGTGFRDPNGIEDVLISAESDELNRDYHGYGFKMDPNNGFNYKHYTYPDLKTSMAAGYKKEDGKWVMPSGEFDGEEILDGELNENNFFDDYGAEPGDGDFHPYNPAVSKIVNRDWNEQGESRNRGRGPEVIKNTYGGIKSSEYGPNPRNPEKGKPYKGRPVKEGVPGSCMNMCTGLCSFSCDNQCSESCFKAGTLIETINGPVPIEEIKVGDLVLTQSGEYHKVYNTMKRSPELNELIKLKIHGAGILYTTKNHPFWIKQYKGLKVIDGKNQQYYSDNPEWIEAKDINPRDKACLLYKKPGNVHVDEGVAYMTGRWLGDGWKTVDNYYKNLVYDRFYICCGKQDEDELEEKFIKYKVKYSKFERSTTFVFSIPKKQTGGKNLIEKPYINIDIINIISKCGQYSHGKFIPQEIFDWDESSIRMLLKGYFDADGHLEKNRSIFHISSTSKRLLYGIAILLRSLKIAPTFHSPNMKNRSNIILGRTVNIRDVYTLSFLSYETTRRYQIFEEDAIWSTIRTPIIPEEKYDVYNISVEGDPTYYADGVLVHNCSSTCFSRCGNQCTSSCGNLCTGCSGQCYSSCKSKCENTAGYACLKAGAKAVKIYSTGGRNGEPAQNHLEAEFYTCSGCSYSCQFYPNKKTTCWDAGCMGKCFTACTNSCSTSCYGGCIDNASENKGDYKSGQGRGCSGGCTVNCIGDCTGTCQGDCVQTCYSSCSQECTDDCNRKCTTHCGSGCENTCLNGCKDECSGMSTSRNCRTGCTSNCQNDCISNCVSNGCKGMCGTGNSEACDSNCRLSCMSSSCTSLCSNACSSTCSSCVNTCGFQCGACSSSCSTDCGALCNINCTGDCENSCSKNCVQSCSEQCGACTGLCFSCVSQCIGICSFKCESTCTSCANQCSYWCDNSCVKECFGNCSIYCISSCSNSCIGSVSSNSNKLTQPYTNREEERKSYKIFEDIPPYKYKEVEKKKYKVIIKFDDTNKFVVDNELDLKWLVYSTTNIAGVFIVNKDTGEISFNEDFFNDKLNQLGDVYLTEELSMFIIKFIKPEIELNMNNLGIKLPWGFDYIGPLRYKDDVAFIIKRRKVKIRKELGGDE